MGPKIDQIRTKWQGRKDTIDKTADSLHTHYSDLGESIANLEWASENVSLQLYCVVVLSFIIPQTTCILQLSEWAEQFDDEQFKMSHLANTADDWDKEA